MDELSEDQIRELEERLYSQIHHQASASPTLPDVVTAREEEEPNRGNPKFLSNRYWVNRDDTNDRQQKQNEKSGTRDGKYVFEKQDSRVQAKSQKVKETPKGKKMYNPFSGNPKEPTGSKSKKIHMNKNSIAPFDWKAQKLQRAMKYENKKNKSKNVKSKIPKLLQPVVTLVLDSSDENDEDVVLVPLPENPVYNIDDSDDEMANNKTNANEEVSFTNKSTENAFISPKSKKLSALSTTASNEQISENISRCNSPNSIISQDDFIGQNDEQRLLKSGTVANDSDLAILTNNSDSLLEPPTPFRKEKLMKPSNDIQCIGTFIKPTSESILTPKSTKKRSYHVDRNAFQAMDVYESESDIVSDGVYTKGVDKSKPLTTIRNVNNSSGSEMDVTTPVQVKTKRLRKRRASESVKGPENNACSESSDTDEDDGVAATCVPFIARGPAVESFKSKKFRKRSTSASTSQDGKRDNAPDSEFMATLNSLAMGSRNNEGSADTDSETENLPSARAIAETVINQEQGTLSTNCQSEDGEERVEEEQREGSEDPDTEIENFPSARVTAETDDQDNPEQKTISTIDQQVEGERDEIGDKTGEGDEITVREGQIKKEVDCQSNDEGNGDGDGEEKEEEQLLNVDENLCDVAVPPDIAEKVEKIFNNITELAKQRAIELSDEDDSEITAELPQQHSVNSATKPQSISFEGESNLDSNIKYFISYSPANKNCISDGFGWNEEIRRFYNNSWGGENVRVDEILNNMNGDRKLWPIIDADRRMYYNRRDRRDKCVNCYSFGHTRARCPKPRKPLMCYMCGGSGHTEPRCPNTRCLRCGNKTSVFSQACQKCMYWNNRICPICKLRGHIMNDCPDKWRRYHSTIRPNVSLNSRVIYNKRRYCCNCGKRGHLNDECNKAMYRSDYPMISSEIKSHEKSYEDVVRKSPSQYQIPCRLLYDPNNKINLRLAEKTSHNDAYGRFLRAVGLEYLIENNTSDNNPILDESTLNDNIELEQQNFFHTQPEQVPEISEGTNETTFDTFQNSTMPPPLPPSQATKTLVDTQEAAAHLDHDSDSNYSFSDHFEGPTTSATVHVKSEPLPDFISLKNVGKEKFKATHGEGDAPMEELSENNPCRFGISTKFVEYFSDDEMKIPSKIPDDMPCEAKIYISNEHSAYFQSRNGQEFLSKIMSDNNIRGRLNKTIVGYALFIHGLPENQEKFQRQLELKFKSLNETRAQQCESSSKVPKNVSVLIRVLQDNISQLYSNLGNASELYKRLLELDNSTSKSSMKSAERIRRTLNMMFLGQAGLSDGDKHIETILNGLHTLINKCKKMIKTPEDLRNEIDNSWRMIFTSYHHKNYDVLLLEYLKIPLGARNRFSKRNLDPSLMGNLRFNINVTNPPRHDVGKNDENLVENSQTIVEDAIMLNVIRDEKTTLQFNNNEISENDKTTKKVQETTFAERLNEIKCHEMLSNITQSPKSSKEKLLNSPNEDCKKPSKFWSRESLNYLKRLIESASDKPSILERLQRINAKATKGGLSYNDYRSVIELYNVTVKMNNK